MNTYTETLIKKSKEMEYLIEQSLIEMGNSLIPNTIYDSYKLISSKKYNTDKLEFAFPEEKHTITLINRYEMHYKDTVYILAIEFNPSDLYTRTLTLEKFLKSPFLPHVAEYEGTTYTFPLTDLRNILNYGSVTEYPLALTKMENLLTDLLNTQKMSFTVNSKENNNIEGTINLVNKFGEPVSYTVSALTTVRTISVDLTSLFPINTVYFPKINVFGEGIEEYNLFAVAQLETLLYEDVDYKLFENDDFQLTVKENKEFLTELEKFRSEYLPQLIFNPRVDLTSENPNFNINCYLTMEGKYPCSISLRNVHNKITFTTYSYNTVIHCITVSTFSEFKERLYDVFNVYMKDSSFLSVEYAN